MRLPHLRSGRGAERISGFAPRQCRVRARGFIRPAETWDSGDQWPLNALSDLPTGAGPCRL